MATDNTVNIEINLPEAAVADALGLAAQRLAGAVKGMGALAPLPDAISTAQQERVAHLRRVRAEAGIPAMIDDKLLGAILLHVSQRAPGTFLDTRVESISIGASGGNDWGGELAVWCGRVGFTVYVSCGGNRYEIGPTIQVPPRWAKTMGRFDHMADAVEYAAQYQQRPVPAVVHDGGAPVEPSDGDGPRRRRIGRTWSTETISGAREVAIDNHRRTRCYEANVYNHGGPYAYTRAKAQMALTDFEDSPFRFRCLGCGSDELVSIADLPQPLQRSVNDIERDLLDVRLALRERGKASQVAKQELIEERDAARRERDQLRDSNQRFMEDPPRAAMHCWLLAMEGLEHAAESEEREVMHANLVTARMLFAKALVKAADVDPGSDPASKIGWLNATEAERLAAVVNHIRADERVLAHRAQRAHERAHPLDLDRGERLDSATWSECVRAGLADRAAARGELVVVEPPEDVDDLL